MNNKKLSITIENQQSNFLYKKNKSNLNITFNRISFIFFVFFIICIVFSIHLIHLGSRNVEIEGSKIAKQSLDKLYRADILDRNQKYLVKCYLYNVIN